MNVIEAKKLSFNIYGKDILKEVSFAVTRGEFVSIIGPNGAGKSTLVKCLLRIFIGGGGAILIKGNPLESYNQRELAKIISYVPQTGEIIPPFTGYEFVLMGRYPYLSPLSSPKKDDHKAVMEALMLTGTDEFSERELSTLSGGERQKVFIAAALAQGSEIMLLDEPTTFLDPKHQYDILKILRKLNEYGVTIIAVTHDINHAVLFSRRILGIKEGKMVFDGPPEGVMKNETLYELYERPFTFIVHPKTGMPLILPDAE
jgi:iron complex transport system ATP-binding protein